MEIKHLKNDAIDYSSWDEHISQSDNQLTYAYSWYLDVVSPGWEALVSSDYEYIMPLPIKRRYGIPYLVQPILTQQLGIFSKHKLDNSVIQKFIKSIPYTSYELNLNEKNQHAKSIVLPNYVLNLNQSYEHLSKHYSKNTKRNIDKARKLNMTIHSGLSPDEFLSFYDSVDKSYAINKLITEKIIENGLSRNVISLYGIYSSDNMLIAALCLLHSVKRITYLLPVSNTEGKATWAMFLLIDKIIHENAGKAIVLDFEGSRMEGIARFYKGFGAKNQPYFILKRFRPSFLIGKLSKK